MKAITAKQSIAARELLKWNTSDITSRTRIRAKRLQDFERIGGHLYHGEMQELLQVFEDAGVVFLTNNRVSTKRAADEDREHRVGGEGLHITITKEGMEESSMENRGLSKKSSEDAEGDEKEDENPAKRTRKSPL